METKVVLVTGSSGSGKTRLIEKLAMEAPMSSAVLYVCHRFMQEFGTTPPLPSSLAARIALGGYASVFDFGSGCACCSPRGDFQRAVEEVLASAKSSHVRPGQMTPPVMFVETTGLADPSVFLSVLAEPALGLKVACVVAVADASNARALLHEPAPANLSNHLAQQVKLADVVHLHGTEAAIINLDSSSPLPLLEDVLSNAASLGTQVLKLSTNENPSNEMPFSRVALTSLLEQRNTRIKSAGAKDMSIPASTTTTAAPNLEAGLIGSGMAMSIDSGFNGGISSGFLNSSLVAHDNRYAAHCAVAVGPPLTSARAAQLRAWVAALVSAEGAPEGSALRVKAVVFLADDDNVGPNSAPSDSSESNTTNTNPTFDPWALPRAAAVLEASAAGGLRWEEFPLHCHDHHGKHCHHHHDEGEHHHHQQDEESSTAAGEAHAMDMEPSSTRGTPQAHCLDDSCPLNGLHPNSPSQAVSGDFSPSEAANSLKAQRSNLVKDAMSSFTSSAAVKEVEADEVSPWRCHRRSRGKVQDEEAEEEVGYYCSAALGCECKLFVLCRGGGNALKASLLGPKLKSLLVPPGFGWAADEEIDFPAVRHPSLSPSTHQQEGAAATASGNHLGSALATATANEQANETEVVHAVIHASSVVGDKVIDNSNATSSQHSQSSSPSVAVALTRHGPRQVLGPSKSCYPAGQTLKTVPNITPPPPPLLPATESSSRMSDGTVVGSETPVDEPSLAKHSYSASSSSREEGDEGRGRALRRQHRVLRLFDGDLYVEMKPIIK